eukprot:SAG31_NODE_2541_length_5536_cov_2.014162_1_plen_78_part_00
MLYQHYYRTAEGIIFVLDSADADRLAVAREELRSLLQEPELYGRPVLILANKQDLPTARTAAQLTEDLQVCERSMVT